jgi:O-antigen/teichoic acid export membrane protein
MEPTTGKTDGSKKSLSKGAIWIGSSRLLVNAIGLVSTLVLARLLVPQDFGLVAVAESVFALVAAVTELMLATSLIQHRGPRAYHYHTAWTLNLSRAVLLAVLMAALGFPFAAIYGDARFIDLFLVLAGATLIGGFENPMLVILSRKLIFWQEFALNVSSKLAGFVVAIGIAYVFRSYWALVIGALAAQATRVLVSYAVIPYRPRFSLRGYRDLLSFSLWLTLSNGIQTANGRLDPVLLGLFAPSATVGQLAVGNKLAYLPVKEGLGPLRSLFFPAFSRMQDDIDRLRHAYLKGQGMVSLIAMPVGFGFALVAAPLVEVALGKNWLPAVPVIQIFAAMSALQASESVQPLAMALDRTRDIFRRDALVLVIRIPLVLAGLAVGAATQMGALMGIVIGSSVASLILLGLSLRLVTVLSGIPIARQLSVTIRPFFAALAMSAGLIIVRNRSEYFTSLDSSLIDIAITIGIGAILYFAALALLWLGSGRPEGAEAEFLTLSHRTWLTIRNRARLGHS